jgi:hypothetical protein
MRVKAGLFGRAAILGGCIACVLPAVALAKPTVCASGCEQTTIKGAIEAAASGATVTVAPGNYYENLEVTKPLTLKGSGPSTVIYPGVSQPTCPVGTEGTLCTGEAGEEASIVVKVAASNVTIENLSVNGNNPKLTSGDVEEGQDIDARGGIVEDYGAGKFNDLTVTKVSISNIWERGLYASSEGTGFNFNHDTVNNVQGEEESIGIFDFGGSGEIVHDSVSNSQDGIALNWSTGTKIEDNKITKTPSGIHTDNNGGFGGTADVIKNNEVSYCAANGYGIFTFATRVSAATVESNKVNACDVAFAAFGSEGVAGTDVKFTDNRANGTGASTTEAEGPTAIYLSTSLLGYGFGPMTATLTGNQFKDFSTGLDVSQAEGGQATVTASENQFIHVALGALGEAGTVVKAENNWWGCAKGPNLSPRCAKVEGTVTYTPWLTSR